MQLFQVQQQVDVGLPPPVWTTLTFHCMRCICHAAMVAATADGTRSSPPFNALMLRLAE